MNAPVVGLSNPRIEIVTAKKLMPIERVILNLMVFTVTFDKYFNF